MAEPVPWEGPGKAAVFCKCLLQPEVIMKKWIVPGLIMFIVSCGNLLGGPSEKDVTIATEAIMECFQTSLTAEPEMQQVYSNAADMTFTIDDGALVNEMSFIMKDDGSVKMRGLCTYNDYKDSRTHYVMNGEFTYRLVFPDANRSDKMYGEINLDFNLQGGKIETLELYFAMNEQEQIEDAQVVANGQDIDFNKWQKVLHIIEPLIDNRPG